MMMFLRVTFGVFVFANSVFAEGAPDTLNQHLWADRVLVLAADDSNSQAIQIMLKRFEENAEDVRDRDLVIYRVGSDHALARRWMLTGPFSLILVGKDGTEKLRSHKPVEMTTLFQTIDAMPMRQREMCQAGQRCKR